MGNIALGNSRLSDCPPGDLAVAVGITRGSSFDITAFDCARRTGGPDAGAACHGTSECPESTCDTSSCAVQSSPAIGGDGTVYVGADDGRVYAIGEPLPSPTPSS